MPGTKTAQELLQEFENIVTSKQTDDKKNELLMFFLNKNKDVDQVIYRGKTLLDYALEQKCPSYIVRKLVSYPISIQAKDSLHIAVKNNNIEVVNVLLENSQSIELNINEKDEKGSTALDYAKPGSQIYALLENHGAAHSEKYQHLTALGIKVEGFDEEKLKTDGTYCFGILEKALNKSSKKGFENVIKYLVEAGYFNILKSKQKVSMEEMAIDWYKENPSQINDYKLREDIDKHLGSQEGEEYTSLEEDLLKRRLTTQYSFQMLKNALEIENTALREKVMGYLITQGVDINCEGKRYSFENERETLLQMNIIWSCQLDEVESLLKLGAKKGVDNILAKIFKDSKSYAYNDKQISLLLKYYNTIGTNELLLKIVKTNDIKLIKNLLKNNKDIAKLQDCNGNTLLSLAIKNNCDNEILKKLLRNGADPYLGNGLTLLKSLVQDDSSDLDRAKILVEALEKVARCDVSKRSQLKSIIDTPSSVAKKTLLERVLSKGKYRDYIAKVFILAGARAGIDIKDKQGTDIFDRSFNNSLFSQWWNGDIFINPLIDITIKERDLFIIGRLLKHERTRDLVIKKAIEGKNTFTIERLLQNQETKKLVEIEVLNSGDLVTKMITDRSDSNDQFLEFLINNNLLNANAKIHGKPLLQLACEADNLDVAKLLVNLGADISTKIEHGYTSLDYVLGKEKEEFLKLFTDKIEGYEKSKKEELLSSAMLHVVQKQKQKVFDKWLQLLKCGASITYQNSDGYNLMHLAQQADRVDCVLGELFLHQLPDVTCKDLVSALSTKNEGKTPIDSINNKPQLSSYKSYFEEYKGRKSREIFYKGIRATALTTLLVGAFAFLPFVELPVALYVAAVVVSTGIACTVYKVHSVGKSIDEETVNVRKNIDSRLSELSTSGHSNSQVSCPEAA